VFISPVSVELVLALAYMGAAGSTAEQIQSALHLPLDRDDVKKGFAALLGLLKVKKDKNGTACWTYFSVSTAFLNIFMLTRLI
jgi:serine protease inhibitor